GVIIGAGGITVTNNHGIEHASRIGITTAGHKRRRGTLVGTDPVTDIAVVKVDAGGLPTLSWGDSAKAEVGEYVVAVGNPFQLNQTVTMGIISATGRSNIGIVDYEDFIQTDAAINPGNSGGALVNARGELIGINTAIYSETGGYQGIGFAVPANLARLVVDQIVAHGRVARGTVGITRVADASEDTVPGGGAQPGALSLQRTYGERLASVLVRQHILTEKFAVTYLGRQLGVPPVDLSKAEIELSLLDVLPLELCEQHLIFPVRVEGTRLQVAMADPLDRTVISEIEFKTGVRLAPL